MTATPPERLALDRLATPIGTALIITDEAGRLRAFDYEGYEPRMLRLARLHYGATLVEPGEAPATLTQAFRDYFAGDLKAISQLAWATAGTAFQREVWTALTAIPAGETTSYGALAVKIGRPTAVRAVGLANGSNPIAVLVPCHRVVGANGALTGYAGGLERKRWLLEHERANAA